MKKIVVIGADGQLGTDLMLETGKRDGVTGTGLTIEVLDITDHEATKHKLTSLDPDVVINTAAYHRVDELETHMARAFEVNVEAVNNLARVCGDLDCALVHVSTDYVFGEPTGNHPHAEGDCPYPESIYAVSKLAGEYVISPYCPKYFVIRACGLYGHAGCMGKGGGNFVETMLKLADSGKPLRVVNDQRLQPTFTRHFAERLIDVVTTDRYGLYHITASGDCTWYEFAKAIFEIAGLSPDLSPATTDEYPTPAKRPPYSVLDNRALREAGFAELPHWREGLREYIEGRTA